VRFKSGLYNLRGQIQPGYTAGKGVIDIYSRPVIVGVYGSVSSGASARAAQPRSCVGVNILIYNSLDYRYSADQMGLSRRSRCADIDYSGIAGYGDV
jgi:hypothetical protein